MTFTQFPLTPAFPHLSPHSRYASPPYDFRCSSRDEVLAVRYCCLGELYCFCVIFFDVARYIPVLEARVIYLHRLRIILRQTVALLSFLLAGWPMQSKKLVLGVWHPVTLVLAAGPWAGSM